MSDINWILSRGCCDLSSIQRIEEKYNIQFPKEYVDTVLEFNGGRPNRKLFDIKNRVECIFEALLNWDESRKQNMFDWMKIIESNTIIAFGQDPFGNAICFDFSGDKENPEVVFWNHELNKFEFIANNYSNFINELY